MNTSRSCARRWTASRPRSTPSPAPRSKPTWSRTAIGVGPKELKDNAERTLFLLDQDGPEPDDTERARRRGVTKGPQGARQDDANQRQPHARRRGRSTRRSSPSGPHRACAIPPTKTPVSRGLRRRPRSTTIIAVWRSASTTRWWRSGAVCSKAVSSGSTTGCRPRSSSAPPCKTWKAAPGSASAAAAR